MTDRPNERISTLTAAVHSVSGRIFIFSNNNKRFENEYDCHICPHVVVRQIKKKCRKKNALEVGDQPSHRPPLYKIITVPHCDVITQLISLFTFAYETASCWFLTAQWITHSVGNCSDYIYDVPRLYFDRWKKSQSSFSFRQSPLHLMREWVFCLHGPLTYNIKQ